MTNDYNRRIDDHGHFRARLQDVKVAVIVTRIDGQIIYWNQFAEKLYGWKAYEIGNHNIMDITVPTLDMVATKATRGSESRTKYLTIKCKDGHLATELVTYFPIFDETDVLLGIVNISHDFTALDRACRDLELQLQERNAELRSSNETLCEVRSRLIHLRDEECRRLARNLHDSLGQLITAIGMNMDAINNQADKLDAAGAKAVAESQMLVAEVGKEVRTISYLLHPPLLDELGLKSALRLYVDGYSTRSKIKVDLIIPADFARLPADMEIACFRIVQECLTNIHRHSKSETAAIIISPREKQLVIEVKDKGIGILPEQLSEYASNGGVGLSGVRERARDLGGILEIKSDANGTAVIATLPLKHATATESFIP